MTGDVTKVEEGPTPALVRDLGKVAAFAKSLPGSDGRIAVLGHSMSSDIVIRYAQAHPEVAATVAVSMFSPVVTPESPKNLAVIVGDDEFGKLKDEGRRVVGMVSGGTPEPGVTYGSFANGTARRVTFSPGVEHIGVLYSPASMAAAVDWLEQAFGQSHSNSYLDKRGPAIGLLFFGLALLAWPLAALLPRVSVPPIGAGLRWRKLLPLAIAPAILTPLILWKMPTKFLPILMADYITLHFALYGLLTAAGLWLLARRTSKDVKVPARPDYAVATWAGAARGPDLGLIDAPAKGLMLPGPATAAPTTRELVPITGRSAVAPAAPKASPSPLPAAIPKKLSYTKFILATLLVAAYSIFAFGLPLDRYVLSFSPIPERVPLLLAVLAGTLPFFLADEWLTRGPGAARGGYSLTKLFFLLSLAIAVALNFKKLFFLMFIIPIILIFFIIYGLFSGWANRRTGNPLVGGTATALAFAWAIAVTFPLLSQ